MEYRNCPACSNVLKDGDCPVCGYATSADYLVNRTLSPVSNMDLFERWAYSARREIRNGSWVPCLKEEQIVNLLQGRNAKETEYRLSSDGKQLLACLDQSNTPVVPVGVQEIGYGVFDSSKIRSIRLPQSLRVIGEEAFRASSLEEVFLPISLQEIRRSAFMKTQLQSVRIPGSVKRLGTSAFYGCENLQTVYIESGVTRIGFNVFSDCQNLRTVVIPDTVTSIEPNAFSRCPNVTICASEAWLANHPEFAGSANAGAAQDDPANEAQRAADPAASEAADFVLANQGRLLQQYRGNESHVEVPEGVEVIGYGAFDSSTVQTIRLPQSLRVIGEEAFRASSLEEVFLPISLQEIRRSAFMKTQLQSVQIPGSVKRLGISAFYGCEKLQTVVLKSGVEAIGANAFSDCPRLETIVIPDTVTAIENDAFYECPNLTIHASETWFAAHPAFKGTAGGKESGRVADFVIDGQEPVLLRYHGTASRVVVPYGVREIGWSAFEGSPVSSVTLPDTVRIIGEEAFRGAPLEMISIPESVREIRQYAFLYTKLQNVVIPRSAQYIGRGAFQGCTKLEYVTVQPGAGEVHTDAFAGCEQLKLIEIPDSLSFSGDPGFGGNARFGPLRQLKLSASEHWKEKHPEFAPWF